MSDSLADKRFDVLYGFPTVSLYDILPSKGNKISQQKSVLSDSNVMQETIESLMLVSGSVTVRLLP